MGHRLGIPRWVQGNALAGTGQSPVRSPEASKKEGVRGWNLPRWPPAGWSRVAVFAAQSGPGYAGRFLDAAPPEANGAGCFYRLAEVGVGLA